MARCYWTVPYGELPLVDPRTAHSMTAGSLTCLGTLGGGTARYSCTSLSMEPARCQSSVHLHGASSLQLLRIPTPHNSSIQLDGLFNQLDLTRRVRCSFLTWMALPVYLTPCPGVKPAKVDQAARHRGPLATPSCDVAPACAIVLSSERSRSGYPPGGVSGVSPGPRVSH